MMNKFKFFLTVLLIIFLFLPASGFCRSKNNLYDKFIKKSSVKVFLERFENKTDEPTFDITGLSESLRTLLKERKSIKFNFVDSSAAADIVIKCDVIKYLWQDVDPIDMIYGTVALAYDVATNENYAYLEATFIVYDPNSKKELWSEDLKVGLTKGIMDIPASMPLINEKTSKAFIKRCFSKRFSKKNKNSVL